MDETLICPYCGQEQYGHEPDEITAFMCSTQCEHCRQNVLVLRYCYQRIQRHKG